MRELHVLLQHPCQSANARRLLGSSATLILRHVNLVLHAKLRRMRNALYALFEQKSLGTFFSWIFRLFISFSLSFFFWFRFLCGFVQWSKSSPRRRLDLFSLLSLSVLFSILCGLLRKRGEGKSAETKKSQERWCFRLRHLAVRFFKGFN